MKKIVIFPNYVTETYQELLDHKAKCRLCFQPVSVVRIFKTVTQSVKESFYSLTNIELKSSDKFSNYICKPCFKSLNEASEFQTKMIDNQRRLYAFEGEADAPVVKAEPIESSSIIELQEISIEDFLPKTEVFEDPWTGDLQTSAATVSEEALSSLVELNSAQKDGDSDVTQTMSCKSAVQSVVKLRKQSKHRYTFEQLATAVEAVSTGEMTVYAAAIRFNVPQSTLHVVAKRNLSFLTDNEEVLVKLHVNKRSESGIPTSDQDIAEYALRLLKKRRGKDRIAIKKPPKTWASFFRKRHSDIFTELSTELEYSCDVCGFSVKGKKNLRTHVSRHVKSCEKRGRAFPKKYLKQDFEAALEAVAEGRFTLYAAANHFKVPMSTLRTRCIRQSGDRTNEPEIHKCSFCEKIYYRKESMRNHEKREHLTPVGEFPCETCGKVFRTEQKRYVHSYQSHEKRSYECKECGEVLGTVTKFRVHQLQHREEVACHVCGKLVKEGFKMTIHKRQHKNEAFKCPFAGCSVTYRTRASLDYHTKTVHEPASSVKCLKCDSTFTNALRMKKHLYKMHGKPKYTCSADDCSYKTYCKQYFRTHITNHKAMDKKQKDSILSKIARKF